LTASDIEKIWELPKEFNEIRANTATIFHRTVTAFTDTFTDSGAQHFEGKKAAGPSGGQPDELQNNPTPNVIAAFDEVGCKSEVTFSQSDC
jgi:hypothetical protein